MRTCRVSISFITAAALPARGSATRCGSSAADSSSTRSTAGGGYERCGRAKRAKARRARRSASSGGRRRVEPRGQVHCNEAEILKAESLVAVTGAAGFIGHAFCARASAEGADVRRLLHTPATDGVAIDLARASVAELACALDGVQTVVHLAGRAHV